LLACAKFSITMLDWSGWLPRCCYAVIRVVIMVA